MVTNPNGLSAPEAARCYVGEGFAPIPVPRGSKKPNRKSWEKEQWGLADIERKFKADANVSLLLGEPSGGLVDVDLDCDEAVAVAPFFLPATRRVSGREGRPRSHHWYTMDAAPAKASEPFRDPVLAASGSTERAMLVELRSTGGHTLVAPSVHPDGGRYQWDAYGEPARVDAADLRRCVALVAVAALVARYWPGNGARHAAALHWSGLLLRLGLPRGDAETVIRSAATVAGDGEVEDRVAAVRSTAEALATGKPATGGPALTEMLGEQGTLLVKAVAKWLKPYGVPVWDAQTSPERTEGVGRTQSASAPAGDMRAWVLPTIVGNRRQHRDIVDDALAALVAANEPPSVFVRGGVLVRVIQHDGCRPSISPLTVDSLRLRLSRCADWVEEVGGQDNPRNREAPPPPEVLRSVVSAGHWPGLPTLSGVTRAPVLHADGSLYTITGYDRGSSLWCSLDANLVLPEVPEYPTSGQVADALAALDDLFCDFPFVDAPDRAAVFAALLTAVLRPLIGGPTPLHLIDKPRAGTGASLIAEVIALVSTGEPAQMKTLPNDRGDEELRKVITALLMAGDPLVVLDNIDVAIRSGHLASVLTSREWTDRVLGRTEMVKMPVQVTWIATGNNIQVRGDIARRSVVSRLDARNERPWLRADFRHPNLTEYVRERRAKILAAVFTLARSWLRAGEPLPTSPALGSFEEWSRVVGGILQFAGVSGFLSNLAEFYEAADEDASEWTAFLEALHDWRPGALFLVRELVCELNREASPLRDAAPLAVSAALGKPTAHHLIGAALASKACARFGRFRLERGGKFRRALRWQVVENESEGDDGCESVSLCESVFPAPHMKPNPPLPRA